MTLYLLIHSHKGYIKRLAEDFDQLVGVIFSRASFSAIIDLNNWTCCSNVSPQSNHELDASEYRNDLFSLVCAVFGETVRMPHRCLKFKRYHNQLQDLLNHYINPLLVDKLSERDIYLSNVRWRQMIMKSLLMVNRTHRS